MRVLIGVPEMTCQREPTEPTLVHEGDGLAQAFFFSGEEKRLFFSADEKLCGSCKITLVLAPSSSGVLFGLTTRRGTTLRGRDSKLWHRCLTNY